MLILSLRLFYVWYGILFELFIKWFLGLLCDFDWMFEDIKLDIGECKMKKFIIVDSL